MSEDESQIVVLQAMADTKQLEDQLTALRQQIGKSAAGTSGALAAFIRRREKAKVVREETTEEREQRDAVQRRLENEQMQRLQAIPGEVVSFEGRRQLMETLDATPERLAELDDIIKDEKSTPADVEEATKAKERLERKEIGRAHV